MNRSTSRPPSASEFALTPKSTSRVTTRSGVALGEDRHELGLGLAEHECRPRLHDPGLLLGDARAWWGRGTRRGRSRRWSRPPPGRRRRWWRPSCPPSPTSITATSTAMSANHSKAAAVDDLHVARPVGQERLDVGEPDQDPVEVLVGDGLAVPRHPLVEALEVGAGVGAHRQARGHEQRGGHAGGGGLAVGAGDVDGRVLELRASPAARPAPPYGRGAPGPSGAACGPTARWRARRRGRRGLEPGPGSAALHRVPTPVDAGSGAGSGSASSTSTLSSSPGSTSRSPVTRPASRRSSTASSSACDSCGRDVRPWRGRPRCASTACTLLFALRISLEHRGGDGVDARVVARDAELFHGRPRGAVHRALLPPRPHFLGDERQVRREEPQQGGQARP